MDVFTLMFESRNSFLAVCGNLSASETPGHWKLGLNCF